jgi:hypothetical protein
MIKTRIRCIWYPDKARRNYFYRDVTLVALRRIYLEIFPLFVV